ncbi:ribosomal protein L7/L12 [Bernardetia sp. OM2101]|uniref:ribosomal protein L7/L12 n=1 Tax=Bernardetia sp. OM2101 TaxID=3344876 RepID=UPI0035CF5E50
MSQLTPKLEIEIINLIKQNRIIEAVKRVKEITGLSLKDSKEYVDSIKNKL